MSDKIRSGPSEEMADEALKRNFRKVAEASYEGQGTENSLDEAMQGLAETHEQIGDDYASGGNEMTFLRDGEDLGKQDGYVPET